jgi:hypothetical protein
MDDVSGPMTHPSTAHVPDDHAGHDRQLVVALACGDLPDEDVADARALIARCRRCAALVDEIERISAATRQDLVAPARPRDFGLTTDDAERLRGGALSRLLRRLGGPRLQVLQPLAGAAMAIGIVLLATTAILPSFSFFAASGAAPAALTTIGSAIGDEQARDASGDAAGGADGAGAPEIAPGAEPAPSASAAPAIESPDIAAYAETDASTKVNLTDLATTSPTSDPVPLMGLGLLVVGALLLLVRIVARRASKDPLLR